MNNNFRNINELIYKLEKSFLGIKDLNSLYKIIHETLKEIIYAENFYVALIDESEDILFFPYYIDKYDPKPPPRERTLDRGLTEFVIKNGKPLLLNRSFIEEEVKKGNLIFYGTCPESYIGAPLRVKDKIIGVIAIQSYEKDKIYSEEDLKIIEYISEHISILIEKKREDENYSSIIRNFPGIVFQYIYEKNKFIFISGKVKEITSYEKKIF